MSRNEVQYVTIRSYWNDEIHSYETTHKKNEYPKKIFLYMHT